MSYLLKGAKAYQREDGKIGLWIRMGAWDREVSSCNISFMQKTDTCYLNKNETSNWVIYMAKEF